MRQKRTVQHSLFDSIVEHEIAIELEGMSKVLDAHPIVLDWVEADLRDRVLASTGRKSLSIESILRCAILKQSRQLTYQELAFFLQDSISLRAFARLAMGCPQKSALQAGIAAISAGTWEQINRLLLQTARLHKAETGRVVRIDSTVTDTPIASPSDSALLHDLVRVSVRLLQQFDSLLPEPALPWQDHRRAAKRLAYPLQYTPKRQRPPTYRKLIKIASRSLQYVCLARVQAAASESVGGAPSAWIEAADDLERLGKAVINQTQRRVFKGETVPSNDKGLEVRERVKSPWVYRKLRNFRAGIEGNISCLKRAYGLSRCTWKGLEHFRSCIWSAVVARNLLLLAKLLQT